MGQQVSAQSQGIYAEDCENVPGGHDITFMEAGIPITQHARKVQGALLKFATSVGIRLTMQL
jgi:hypothetical protein